MGNEAEGIHAIAVEEQVNLHQVTGAVAGELIVQRGVALGVGLEGIKEIVDDLVEGHLIVELHQVGVEILHVLKLAAALLTHGHDVAHEVLRCDDGHLHIGLFGVLDSAGVGVVVGVIHLHQRAVGFIHMVDDGGQRGDEVEIELTLEALLNNLHVEHAQEAAAETKAQGHGRFRLEGEGGVVQLQLFQCVTEVGVLAAVLGVDTAVDHGLGGTIAGQGLSGRIGGIGDGVAHLGVLHVLNGGGEVADLTGLQTVGRLVSQGLEVAALQNGVLRAACHQADGLTLADRALHNAEENHHAHIGVILAVEHQGAEGRIGIAGGSGQVVDDALQHRLDVNAQLGRDLGSIEGGQADDVLHLLLGLHHIGGREVDLIKHGHDLQLMLHGEVGVGQRLCLHALGRVHHQQRAFAGGERAADLIVEVHVTGGVDEVQGVGLAVVGSVEDLHGAGLDGDAALLFQLHVIQQLVGHLALRHGVTLLQQAVSQRGFAVVNMGDDGEITNLTLVKHTFCQSSMWWFARSSALWSTWAALCPKPGMPVRSSELRVGKVSQLFKARR